MVKISDLVVDDSSVATDVSFNETVTNQARADTESIGSIDFQNLLAHKTVKHWSQWSSVAGFIPVSFLDTFTISGLQIKMIYELCKVYGVPFKKETAQGVISGLLAGSTTSIISGSISTALIRHIPYVGTPLCVITQPVLAYASTYALGVVFIQHFESEGNLKDFAIESVRDFYDEQFSKVKSILKVKKMAPVSPVKDVADVMA